ncbi:SDR family NAD(P)-dependent oxidoreductase [Paenibacillus sp. yr247]|uniref:SDR family NAD(P)-dependent oxidoreductase n=1 Tax=Paenibacillus sp. yr247 TaxID=1761880 RepID=UPI0020C849B6|nr:SDR family NAD(P)-dependent oxidoreductase [Paenibacillus sp. yr247]
MLVNNGHELLSDVDEAFNEEVKQNYDANVFGLLNVIRTIFLYMCKQCSGYVINISSVGGLGGYVGWGIYSYNISDKNSSCNQRLCRYSGRNARLCNTSQS